MTALTMNPRVRSVVQPGVRSRRVPCSISAVDESITHLDHAAFTFAQVAKDGHQPVQGLLGEARGIGSIPAAFTELAHAI